MCAPLREFIAPGKDWPALEAWARSTRTNGWLLRNMLAWLESKGQAYEYSGKWYATQVKPKTRPAAK